MAVEIEKKFLVNKDLWNEFKLCWRDELNEQELYGRNESFGHSLLQGYIVKEKTKTIRLRIEDDEVATLTIKGKTEKGSISRQEYEYEIPVKDALEMSRVFCDKGIQKTRYKVPFEGHIWEVDEFHGHNYGLLVAEIELKSEDEEFVKPDWVTEEVSHDNRYFNSNLIDNPYQNWL